MSSWEEDLEALAGSALPGNQYSMRAGRAGPFVECDFCKKGVTVESTEFSELMDEVLEHERINHPNNPKGR